MTKKRLGATKSRLRVTHKDLLKLFKTAPIFNKVEKIGKCLQQKKNQKKIIGDIAISYKKVISSCSRRNRDS